MVGIDELTTMLERDCRRIPTRRWSTLYASLLHDPCFERRSRRDGKRGVDHVDGNVDVSTHFQESEMYTPKSMSMSNCDLMLAKFVSSNASRRRSENVDFS